ncbi:MAG: type II toxin-antitoxin system HigB family toxin [Proteobacteria bacterium]|nr:type II toxin-antitoxin system HigB family toxin [Pseudomonadota bacterium]
MRIISKRKLREFWLKHPQAEIPLNNWFKTISKCNFKSLVDLKAAFPSADLVGKLIIFNVSGNKFRLITAIHFNTNTVYVRDVLTHAEYDKEGWKA